VGVKDLQDLKKISILRSQIDGMKIEEIMSTDYPTVEPDERLSNALHLMKKTGYQDIPVIEDGEYIGTISYGAVLKKKNVSLDSKIRNHITTPPVIMIDEDITEAAEIMVMNNSRQLIVVNANKKKVIGVVSRRAMISLAIGIKAFKEIKVWEIMTNPVDGVLSRNMLNDALDIMIGLDIRTVPVINDAHRVIGVIGMNEIIENNWKDDTKMVSDLDSNKTQLTVESICTSVVYTVNWDDDLGKVIDIMLEHKISTLPVVENDELVGIITQYDIIELISACRERDFLFVQISGLDDMDKAYTSAIYDSIKREIDKIGKIVKPQSFTMHVSKYKEKGEKNKYSISARLIVNGTAVSAKEVGWDLVKTADNLMKKISTSIIEMKDTKDTFRKRKH
jgi:CBS domain-containing protein/ribosome-associated translation inhibitor RaiA